MADGGQERSRATRSFRGPTLVAALLLSAITLAGCDLGGSDEPDDATPAEGESIELDGFAAIPLMEDVEFSRRLRRAGKVTVLDPPVSSSGRRHGERGAWRTSLENGLFIVLYRCGCSPARLHRWYYRERFALPDESLVIAPVEDISPR